jgi:uncharacterized protein
MATDAGAIPGIWRGSAWTRRALKGARLLAGGAAIGALGVVGAGYYVASTLTRPGRPSPTDEYVFTPFEVDVPHEPVTFPPEEGDHFVRGWWLKRPESRRVIIACTGYRAKMSDLLGISSALWRAGNNVLLFDFHGHGAGLGAPVTLAYREMNDFLGALDYARRRLPGARIGVIGYSMGAAVAIMGSARRSEVRAVVADSSFASHADEVRYSIAKAMRLPAPLVPAVAEVADHFLFWRAGYRHRDVEPVHDVGRLAPRPLLIIHSQNDEMIPVEHAFRLFDAAGEPKELWIENATSHCGSYFVDRKRYCRRVADFFARHLDGEDESRNAQQEASREAEPLPRRERPA